MFASISAAASIFELMNFEASLNARIIFLAASGFSFKNLSFTIK